MGVSPPEAVAYQVLVNLAYRATFAPLRLSHQACALYLFLLTVADAQGLSYYAEPTVCRRLSLSQATLQQARQELITRHLLAYRRPLYQVLALESHDTQATEPLSSDDGEVDIKAVFKRIWEALS